MEVRVGGGYMRLQKKKTSYYSFGKLMTKINVFLYYRSVKECGRGLMTLIINRCCLTATPKVVGCCWLVHFTHRLKAWGVAQFPTLKWGAHLCQWSDKWMLVLLLNVTPRSLLLSWNYDLHFNYNEGELRIDICLPLPSCVSNPMDGVVETTGQ